MAAPEPAAPGSRDFSPQAVARAVLRDSLQSPLVLYPTAVGLLGGFAAVLLGPSLLFVAPAAIGMTVGVGCWAFDYTLRREQRAAEHIRRLQAELSTQAEQSMRRLRGDLESLGFEAGLAQLAQLHGKFTALADLLRSKLNPQEVTFVRYLGMSEQVFLAGLDNLRRIVDTQKGLSAIDPKHVTKRLKHLAGDGIESPAQDREIAALEDRLALLARQREAVDRLLAENESAMTQIDRVMAAIASLDTSAGHASMTMESAMTELKELADRAHRYSGEASPPPEAPADASAKRQAVQGKTR